MTAAYALLKAPHLCSKLLLNHARIGCAWEDIPLPAEICAAHGSQVIRLSSCNKWFTTGHRTVACRGALFITVKQCKRRQCSLTSLPMATC